MKRFFLLLCVFFCSLALAAQSSTRTLRGFIKCNNIGIKNVVITDGKNLTLTRTNGDFVLERDTTQKYIYYSLPSGYESPIEHGVPIFYKPIEIGVKSYNFELTKAKYSQKKQTLIAWADPQVIDPEEFKLLETVVSDVNQTIASYGNTTIHALSLGDQVFDKLNLIDSYKDILVKMNIPFYQVVGNHDMDYTNQTHETSTKTYEKEYGPAYYSFNIGDIHYIVLDDVFYFGYKYHYMGYFNQQQINWLQADLSHVKKGSTVIVSLHIPTKYHDIDENPNLEKFQKNSLVNNQYFYDQLKGYNTHIFAGHSHTQWNTLINDSLFEHTHAAACAAWWQGEIGLDGTPRGYTVYEIDGSKLTWYFKGVGTTKNDQFKLYPIGADIDSPEAFVANVYNYDPQWKVVWKEDGVLAGTMTQYWGVDPLARELYQPGTNKKYSWLGFSSTSHLFKAVPKNKNAKISVEVVDRFGNKYSQTLAK